MKTFYDKYKRDIYSQQGEDGLIEECLRRMNKTMGTCAEFGAHNGKFCSNTYNLLKKGWAGAMFEGDSSHEKELGENLKGLKCNYAIAIITKENINKAIPFVNVLSMDTDGPDAEIWAAYTGSPDIVIIEINSSLDPDKDFYSPDKGANYSYMKKLGESKGYFLLCHTGNLIFVLSKYKELFPDADETFRRDWIND